MVTAPGNFSESVFAAFDDGDGQEILREIGVYIEHAERFFLGFFGGFVRGVAFLPEKFGGAQAVLRGAYLLCRMTLHH